ncbi:hypothetical protein BDB00DRAFT_409048 [Zychaea mexicana]|uniref:uncharacterized protein n=1 Tax=Zychaea mexicana TaxID=64656 RepID=UPI0022FE5BDE|nr:uncharacterized protein BDB00DRAFT_409048 [Zychaea mexicana]KAI9492952.1 hypothetical protein BDB00DRAFT_409048 [Zychaea mexicana]
MATSYYAAAAVVVKETRYSNRKFWSISFFFVGCAQTRSMFQSATRPLLLQQRSFATSVAITKNSGSVKVDKDCLPLSATWSIRSLLASSNDQQQASITDEQFNHLFRLAQLRPPESQKEQDNLKRDLEQMARFTQQIQQLAMTDVEPLVQLWEDNVGMITRSDNAPTESGEPRGRVLLQHAEQKQHGHFYVVQTKVSAEAE